jgi:hypothetical protein
MTDTANLGLPLVQPAQAQKHVTVNEALARIDGLAQLTLVSVSETVPPVSPAEGTAYGVPAGAVNAWAGQAGHVAVVIGGGWVFVPARHGVAGHGAGCGRDGGLRRRGLAPRRGDAEPRGRLARTCGRWKWTSRFRPGRIGGHAAGLSGARPSPSGSRGGSRRRSRERRHRGDRRGGRHGALWHRPRGWRRIHGSNGPGAPVVYWDATPLVMTAVGGGFRGRGDPPRGPFRGAWRCPSSEASLSTPVPGAAKAGGPPAGVSCQDEAEAVPFKLCWTGHVAGLYGGAFRQGGRAMAKLQSKISALDPVWQRITKEATKAVADEPLLGGMLHAVHPAPWRAGKRAGLPAGAEAVLRRDVRTDPARDGG